MKDLRQAGRTKRGAKLQEEADELSPVPSMRRILLVLAACGSSVLLYPVVFFSTAPAVQSWMLLLISLLLGGVIGVLVQPPRLSGIVAFLGLGVGAFAGTVATMELISPHAGDTSNWWSAAMVVSVIAGLFQGALAAISAGIVSIAFRARRTQVAENRSA